LFNTTYIASLRLPPAPMKLRHIWRCMYVLSIDTSSVTWSSATAEKQCVSCACLSRLANWSCDGSYFRNLRK